MDAQPLLGLGLLAKAEAKGLRRFAEATQRIGWRIVLENQAGVERHPEELAHAAKQPQKVVALQGERQIELWRLRSGPAQAEHDGFFQEGYALGESNGCATRCIPTRQRTPKPRGRRAETVCGNPEGVPQLGY